MNFGEYFEEVNQQVYMETGIRNINELTKTHNIAEIYFHMDL